MRNERAEDAAMDPELRLKLSVLRDRQHDARYRGSWRRARPRSQARLVPGLHGQAIKWYTEALRLKPGTRCYLET